jgi:transcriptional regulatory protein AMDR
VKEVRDALVESFFNDINPGFPVVDEAEFRMQYEDKDSPPPLLLFHAVLLAGAHACTQS